MSARTDLPVSIRSIATSGPSKLHEAHRAAETGMDAELHFRQGQRHLRIIRRDAVAAGERQFEAAAQRKAVDRSDGGAGQRLQAIEHLLAGADQLKSLLRRGQGREFLDVRARR